MSKYKGYPVYKDSGVEWLGEVPKTLGCCSVKAVIVEKWELTQVEAEIAALLVEVTE